MKTIYLLFVLAIVACQKEPIDPDPVNIIGPQEVHFDVYTRSNTLKRIVVNLYAVDSADHSKRIKLVGTIDTLVTTKYFRGTLTSNVKPVMYCSADFEVYIVDDYDTVGIEINNDAGLLISRGASCPVNYYELNGTDLRLMINNM